MRGCAHRQRVARWALATAFGLAAASWQERARAAPFELSWSAPAGCPSREAIVAATRARLGESWTNAAPELFVQGAVSEEGGGFVVTLTMKHASGEPAGERRVRVDHRSCKEIEKPTSLVLAMMIAVARPPEATPEVATPPEIEPSPSQVDRAPPPERPPLARSIRRPRPGASPPSPSSHRFLLGAAVVLSRGLLPNTGFGGAIRATYVHGRATFGVEASLEDGGDVTIASGEVGFHLLEGGARVGFTALRAGRVELVPTVGAKLVRIGTSATGFPAVDDQHLTTVLLGPGLIARFALARSLFVEGGADVDVVLARDRFAVREGSQLFHLHRPSTFTARFSLGFGYEF